MSDTYIRGHYKKSIYQNESGYTIGLFKVQDASGDDDLDIYVGRTMTFTGYFHELNELDTYLFYGKLVNHERYGEQFQVTAYERVMPDEKNSILEFLTSGLFKGIGEKKAERIVDALGKDTLTIILEHPDNLLLIPTVTQKNVQILHDKLVEYQASYQIILDLSDIGFSTKDSMMIYKKYGSKTMDVIKQNIYQLMEDFGEITFKKIDAIALRQGMMQNDTRRIQAGILYVIEEVSNTTGHCYFYSEEIFHYLGKVLATSITEDEFEEALDLLLRYLKIFKLDSKYYLRNMYDAEMNIASRFQLLAKGKIQEEASLDDDLKELEEYFDITYNADQKMAIKRAYLHDFLIITGGPGTGKTTIIKAICEFYRLKNHLSYESLKEKLVLLAPTGRASKRMSEATLLPAQTIHRFLKWNKDTNTFAINEYHKSDAEFVIIDEASMVDTILLDHLLKGLSYKTKIILVGDYHQLPSVSPGQVLRDLIESDVLPVVFLNQLYRQGEDSHILSLAYDLKDGSVHQDVFLEGSDLEFVPVSSTSLSCKLEEISKQFLDLDYRKFQVLAPMYKTINGIDLLNQHLQEVFNPKSSHKKELVLTDVTYREQDKVIQLSNMPDENVYNGDIGIIEKIENGNKRAIYINFDGNVVKYTASNFSKFKHGFAISIHKSQGSEFDVVVMPMVKDYGKMLYRKLVYTGVTRSKKKLIILGDMDALVMASLNNESDIRRTSIKEMLNSSIK